MPGCAGEERTGDSRSCRCRCHRPHARRSGGSRAWDASLQEDLTSWHGGDNHLQVNHIRFASVFQKPSLGFAYAFISGEAKMEQIIDKLQTNTGREGTKPTTSCCFFLRRQGGGDIWQVPRSCAGKHPCRPRKHGNFTRAPTFGNCSFSFHVSTSRHQTRSTPKPPTAINSD